jgi:hypothetical protein
MIPASHYFRQAYANFSEKSTKTSRTIANNVYSCPSTHDRIENDSKIPNIVHRTKRRMRSGVALPLSFAGDLQMQTQQGISTATTSFRTQQARAVSTMRTLLFADGGRLAGCPAGWKQNACGLIP